MNKLQEIINDLKSKIEDIDLKYENVSNLMAELTLERVNLNRKITDNAEDLALLKSDKEIYAESFSINKDTLFVIIKLVIESIFTLLLYIISILFLVKTLTNPLNVIGFLAFVISGILTTKSILKERASFKERINIIKNILIKYSSYDEIKEKIKSLESELAIKKARYNTLTELIQNAEAKSIEYEAEKDILEAKLELAKSLLHQISSLILSQGKDFEETIDVDIETSLKYLELKFKKLEDTKLTR